MLSLVPVCTLCAAPYEVDGRSWVAVALDVTDPEVDVETQDEPEDEPPPPMLSEEQTVELFGEMGGYFSEDEDLGTAPNLAPRLESVDVLTAEPEPAAKSEGVVQASARRTAKPGRRPPCTPPHISGRPGDEPTADSFLQTVTSLVQEGPSRDPDEATNRAGAQTERGAPPFDKHGFRQTDGRGRHSGVRSGQAVDWLLGNHADELTPCARFLSMTRDH